MQQVQTHFRWFRSFRRLWLSGSLVVLLVLFALVNATLFLLAQKPATAQAQNVPATSQVSEGEPAITAEAASTATPTHDTITIDSIGLSSQFVTVGLTNTNAIDVSPSLVGWWNGSARPGTPGAAFLDGHNPGVFSKLPSIAEGAHITLTQASGEVFNYTVVHIETVQLAGINMRAALSTYGGAKEGLNLMTCIGPYNEKTGTTDQRLVVYAVRS